MIEVKNLSKHYKIVQKDPGLTGAIKSLFKRKYTTKKAVDEINFNIEDGEMVGYIGANGAGKSTTIKMLCGILTPSNGEITVNGIVPYKERKRNAKNIGAVFGQRTQLFWDIAVRESYELLKHIYEIPEEEFQASIAMFTEVLDLEPLMSVPVRQLSLGQKMRCELAAAFLHNPSIVYLDEPTIGLDVAVKVKIRQFIREMNRLRGTTVILTTHDMQDIEEICKRIIIIDEGKVLYDGSLQSIKERYGDKRIIHFELEREGEFQLPSSMADKVEWSYGDEGRVSISFSNHTITAADVISEMLQSYQIRDLTIADSKIETIVQDIYMRGI
ncbi:ABC-2 type transport system ATP-binding protein [Fontibacillus panacisegetis]|uniref:ABC-2 type transport system ATP-binding protein n=1 Tax=Fontibacillus panacisegetis TaxID=670482 RepID=A0A1G7R327_9BACL|nr:ATP-binding cassette domain-containing protein [Fontibacillus panacisegetis]SDG05163.1 ABC-2 type transport system ATP-binding protein [Fontibacillus panacisegetis]